MTLGSEPPAGRAVRRRPRRVLPGFGLSLGYTMFYLSLIVLIPLAVTFGRLWNIGAKQFFQIVTGPAVLSAFRVSLSASLVAGLINVVFGLLVAWVLVRYRFPGKRLVDAMVDLPFALPTAVAGIALTQIYAPNGWLGGWLQRIGVQAAYSWLGVAIALTFIGLPCVVRTVQPVLEDFDVQYEQAAWSLGATPWQTFCRVTLPEMTPALLTGFALAFARGFGEFGSVVFISGNLPFRTEIVPLIIYKKLENTDYNGAIAVAVAMLVISFALLFVINLLQRWSSNYREV